MNNQTLPLTASKRIIVTGGAGFIGSNLVRTMIAAGHDVLNLDKLTYAGNLNSLTDVHSSDQYKFANVDIVDMQAVNQAIRDFRPEAILHLAAESHVDRSIDGPRQFIETNVLGTFNLLHSALGFWRELANKERSAFRFLHVSTDEVYGSLGPSGYFTESTAYDPHSPYSASKASSDHLARAWHDTYGLPVIVTNCSNNYGPYQFPEKLIPVVILKCLRGESIPVYGKGENIRDWLYVDDHCRALEMVLSRGKPGQTYNIGGNNEMRNIDLVYLLCNLMDELSPTHPLQQQPIAGFTTTKNQEPRTKNQEPRTKNLITFVTDRPGHDMRYAIDASKIHTELGWSPLESVESGFRKTVKWYLENSHWWQAILSGEYKLERQGLTN